MSTVRLLTLQETITVAEQARARANREPFDPRRALDGLSMTAIISMTVLIHQLDSVAQAAARAEDTWRRAHAGEVEGTAAADVSDDLIRLLKAAGYLPLPLTSEPEEAAHGAR